MGFKFFWISPAFSSDLNKYISIIHKLNQNATLTIKEGSKDTLHISTAEDVIARFSTRHFYISDQCLLDIDKRGLTDINFLSPENQYLSLCLLNVYVTSSGFTYDETNEIAKKVMLLGGVYQKTLEKNTSVVIASKTATEKVYSASESNIPIVTIDWIMKCYEKFINIPISLYKILPFSGCKFTSTDLTSIQNKKLSEIIQENGGEWSDKYYGNTTFLIAQTLSNTAKIKLCLSENNFIVKPEWVLRTNRSNILPPYEYTLNWWCLNDKKTGIFQGISFGISKELHDPKLLIDIILANNGHYMEKPDYYISNSSAINQYNKESTIVTPRWLLLCASEKKLIDPQNSPTFRPLPFSDKIEGVTGKSFFLKVQNDAQRLEYADLLRMFGATVFFKFSKQANVIVADSATDRFRERAKDYTIPIVGVSWIDDLAKNGVLPDIDAHKLRETPDFRKICLEIKRFSKRIGNSANEVSVAESPRSFKNVDFTGLESYTQQTEESKSKQQVVAYDQSQENVEFQASGDKDPFLEAFNIGNDA